MLQWLRCSHIVPPYAYIFTISRGVRTHFGTLPAQNCSGAAKNEPKVVRVTFAEWVVLLPMAHPGFHFGGINLTNRLSHLLCSPFVVQYMAICGYKFLCLPWVRPSLLQSMQLGYLSQFHIKISHVLMSYYYLKVLRQKLCNIMVACFISVSIYKYANLAGQWDM